MRQSNTIISLSVAFFASALAACGAHVESGSSEDVSTGALEQGNGNPDCVTGLLQRSSCADPSDIKVEAYDLCSQEGLTLTQLQYEPVCDGSTVELAQYECCAPALPPSPGPGCFLGSMGDAQTCQGMDSFKLSAHDACMQAGFQLANLDIVDVWSCAGGEISRVEYECCPAPPPPVVCLASTLGDGQTCMSLDNIKVLAYEACNQAGFVLFDVHVADVGSCNPNEGLLVEYECTAESNTCP